MMTIKFQQFILITVKHKTILLQTWKRIAGWSAVTTPRGERKLIAGVGYSPRLSARHTHTQQPKPIRKKANKGGEGSEKGYHHHTTMGGEWRARVRNPTTKTLHHWAGHATPILQHTQQKGAKVKNIQPTQTFLGENKQNRKARKALNTNQSEQNYTKQY